MLTPEYLQSIQKILPPQQILTGELAHHYGHDYTSKFKNLGIGHWVALPKTIQELQSVLKFCHAHNICMIPTGGRTGLAGSAVSLNKELIISLEKMNKIIKVDPISGFIEAEAGVVTEELQKACSAIGYNYPIDLAAKGSSQLGGNLATNAGGIKFIRYGGMREQVLGLEVMLVDGTILNLNKKLFKNNSGYDLKQLFIGSEGTLGFITKATIKIYPKPKKTTTYCFATNEFDHILEIFKQVKLLASTLGAFEFFDHSCRKIVGHQFKYRPLFEKDYAYYMILDLENSNHEEAESFIENLFSSELIQDGLHAEDREDRTRIWNWRENISESITLEGHVIKNDISIPIHELSSFISSLKKMNQLYENIQILCFGHIGDGNIHINILNKNLEPEKFYNYAESLNLKILQEIINRDGSMSAEHGIGLVKKDWLKKQISQEELSLMKNLKKTLDPKNLLNPGKIF
jgi:glycolate oxidase subunit GlcD